MFKRRIVIVGGLGRTGRRVFDRLHDRGIDAAGASRSTHPGFDWEDQRSWPGALRGATAIYATYPAGLAAPRAAGDVGRLASMAADLGVEHVVLLSLSGVRAALRAEQRLRRAPLDHTILRAGRRPGASDDDALADLAVAALSDPAHLNRTYEVVTGRRGGEGPRVREVGRAGAGRSPGVVPAAWRSAPHVESGARHPSSP